MSNILIIVDLEVIIGVEDLWDKKVNEALLYKEIFTIINSIPDNMDVYLCYSHNDGILPSNLVGDLDPEIHIIKKINNINFGIDYKAAFLIGFHGKKSDCCRFPHTFREEIEEMFLGEKEVGEIEMIVNLLSYYKIPVPLISTEALVINYLDYDCIYHDVDKGDINLVYLNLENDVKEVLNRETTLQKFDNSKVEIIYKNYIKKRTKELGIDIQSSFKNTIDFFNYLPKLHVPLNYIIKKDIDIWDDLIKNKPESIDVIKDDSIKKLLEKDINLVNYLELCEVLEHFNKIKDGYKNEK